MSGVGVVLLAGALILTLPGPGSAQGRDETSADPQVRAGARVVSGCCSGAPPALHALRVDDARMDIDGRLDEPEWAAAQVAADFVQFQPDEGAPATEKTEARVLYGAHALFVAIRAYDSQPHEIVGQLTRRDQPSHSDLVGVVIDSYFDRRTAFQFVVNPVGVKYDVYRFDDVEEDDGWDAVWDVATTVDEEGWTAEFRIPYSQLRFRDAPEQTWGINFMREIARKQELDVWAPTTRASGGIVSKFGELRGLRGLEPPRRLEVLPYSLARLRRAPGDDANPFYERNATAGTVGADLKYGVTSDLTLDVTINPDFGQVEADPAQVNLTAFETFFPERRPFFLEGSSIFNFSIALGDGDDANESLFYSRRIGRAPQGRADPEGGYTEADDQTTILGAWKLSGKTAGGWSVGALHAVTAEERARVAPAAGEPHEVPVEPLTNYGVLRLQKDLREGRSAVGIIATATRRDREVADAHALNRAAYAGGLDVRHRFRGDTWQVSGYVLASRVEGSADAIARVQRAPARYFQRPDAGHVRYDPERTSLSGASANLAVSKFAGSPWRVGTGIQTRTPGFETNDLGFLRDADFLVHWGWLGYHHTSPQGPFRNWFLNFNGWQVWNYDGDRIGTGGNLNANFQLKNFWNGWFGVNREFEAYSDGLLRGGPLMKREAQTNFWGGFATDSRKAVHLRVNTFGNVRPESDSWSLGVSPNLRIRPSGRATFSVGTFVHRNVDDLQWIGRLGSGGDATYLFGRIHQTTVGITTRVDFAFTPTLSLQLYAQPFVSGGRYTDFKRVTDPRAERYDQRIAPVAATPEGDRVTLDLEEGPVTIGNPDFNFRQFRSNAVLRWEYRPGSTLFLVWSQGRNDFLRDGSFRFGRDMEDLFGAPADDVFMIKVSYWFSR